MAKRLFHSCRSPSAAAAVTPTTTLLPCTNHPPVVPAPAGGACCPRRAPRRRPGRRPPSQPPTACGAAGCDVDYGADDLPPARGTPAYRWLKSSSRWHVIEAATGAYAYAATDGDEESPRLKIDARRRARRSSRRRRPRRRVSPHRGPAGAGTGSWSSGDSGWFSSASDGEPYGAQSSSALPVASTTTTTESSSTAGASGSSGAVGAGVVAREQEDEDEECSDATPLAGGFAVVKRSDDPRADFRRSMAEMVVGRAIYDADGLERLLRCFLALNDRRHRRDIVAAFGDVWEAVFSSPPAPHSQPSSCKAAAAVRHP